MIRDMQLSRNMQQELQEWQQEGDKAPVIDLQVSVLTVGLWPSYKVHR